MTIGAYESNMFQHNTLPLVFALWSDNNIVKTLSNFHSPTILAEGHGVRRRKRVGRSRDHHQSDVSCPAQMKAYCETFHQIDKGNGAESNYDMGGHSKTHNWAPKLTMRYFNMNMNNAFQVYCLLVKKHTPTRRVLAMPEAINELAHALMQCGEAMRTRKAEHPMHLRDMTNVFDHGTGRAVRSDAKGFIARRTVQLPTTNTISHLLEKQKKEPWRKHQSVANTKQSKCCWINCIGKRKSTAARKRSYDTFM